MKTGLRLRILAVLGALLLLSLLPLFYALSTYIRWTLAEVALGTAQALEKAAPLVKMTGLYMGLVGLAFLVVSYFALTRLVVTPLDGLSRAARRVVAGARDLEVPRNGPKELIDLGESLRIMTDHLRSEEQALRRKIDEVERATQGLRDAQDRLVRSERLASVGRLAAGLAHEVGNPIAAILGLQDLLLGDPAVPEEQRDFIRRMRKETERINHILRDLLDFARPSTRPVSGVQEMGDVEGAVHDVLALVAPQKSASEVQLTTALAPDLPRVTLPREQLVQVILNLVLNAVDACPAGSEIRVAGARSTTGVTLAVEDDGPGVAPEIRDRLFEPFATTKEVGKGTGLGLAVCRGLVEASGGTIALDAEHHPGARFVVELRT